MPAVNWLNQRPEDVAGSAEPAEVLSEIKKVRTLDPSAQRVVDYALAQWTLAAIARDTDIDGVIELGELAALAIRALPENAVVFRASWQTLHDLLESKRLAIGAGTPTRALNLLHAAPILELLKKGEMTQSELRQKLHLSAARLSQVLAVMEEGRLIRRRKQGKENLVALHAATSNATPQTMGGLLWGKS